MHERTIATGIHGRCLIHPGASSEPMPLLVGFHGYAEDAEAQMERLRAIPGSEQWLLLSIQALNRFYDRRTGRVVASWMTRQNRELAIGDNTTYIRSTIDEISAEWAVETKVVFAGFSQGVGMAFRAATSSVVPVAGVIAAGGDIPPEISSDGLKKIDSVLIARGTTDTLYPADQFARDEERLRAAPVPTRAFSFTGAHEWNADMAEEAGNFLRQCRLLN